MLTRACVTSSHCNTRTNRGGPRVDAEKRNRHRVTLRLTLARDDKSSGTTADVAEKADNTRSPPCRPINRASLDLAAATAVVTCRAPGRSRRHRDIIHYDGVTVIIYTPVDGSDSAATLCPRHPALSDDRWRLGRSLVCRVPTRRVHRRGGRGRANTKRFARVIG